MSHHLCHPRSFVCCCIHHTWMHTTACGITSLPCSYVYNNAHIHVILHNVCWGALVQWPYFTEVISDYNLCLSLNFSSVVHLPSPLLLGVVIRSQVKNKFEDWNNLYGRVIFFMVEIKAHTFLRNRCILVKPDMDWDSRSDPRAALALSWRWDQQALEVPSNPGNPMIPQLLIVFIVFCFTVYARSICPSHF